MNRFGKVKLLCAAAAVGLVLHAPSVFACAACFGKSDSPLAKGMNWGIFSLLAVVVTVLSGIASFFVYLGRKAADKPVIAPESALPEANQKD
jgi:hypothetical protein